VRPPAPPGPYLVVGLARSGTAAARALHARGEQVTAYDAKAKPALDGIELVTGGDGVE
jgi:UDP-N-acetylmuramoylalanine--D-glutamate ligase